MPEENLGRELQELKREVLKVLSRLNQLEDKLQARDESKAQPLTPPDFVAPSVAPAPPEEEVVKLHPFDPVTQTLLQKERVALATPPEKDRPFADGFESKMGRFWFNKVGIAIFTLGIAFLISYTFKYFGVWAKIALGYAVSLILFWLAGRCEKNASLRHFGGVLCGGGWALVYFTTYAMHHFPASRIIASPFWGLCLLMGVSVGMVTHALYRKSEESFAVALFMAYVTSTISVISTFTFVSCLFLAGAVLWVVASRQWFRMIFFGVTLTYASHVFWLTRQSSFVGSEIQLGFYASYWALFTLGVHFFKKNSDRDILRKLALANFLNFLAFFTLFYPEIGRLYPTLKMDVLLSLGAVYFTLTYFVRNWPARELFVSNLLIGLSLLTWVVPLKYDVLQTTLIWLLEVPFLLALGVYVRSRSVQGLALVLAIGVFLKILLWYFWRETFQSDFFLGYLSRQEWNYLIGGFSMFAAFFLLRRYRGKFLEVCYLPEAAGVYAFLATVYLTLLNDSLSDIFWLRSLNFTLEGFLLLGVGLAGRDVWLRRYGVILLGMVVVTIFFDGKLRFPDVGLGVLVLAGQILIFYLAYVFYQQRMGLAEGGNRKSVLKPFLFWSASLVFLHHVWMYLPSWRAVSLGLSGSLLLAVGFFLKDRAFRFAGMGFFVLVVGHLVFYDLPEMSAIPRIVTFITLGLVFLLVSYGYSRYASRVQDRANFQ